MKNYVFRVYKSKAELPKGELPEKVYAFREPDSSLVFNLIVIMIAIPFLFLIMFIARQKGQDFLGSGQSLLGMLLAILMVLPHEMLHAVCFPKTATKYVIALPSMLVFAVLCTVPISKARYIGLSLLPNLVFGFIPFLIWILLPDSLPYSEVLLGFSALNILCGCGDYMNMINAAFQMPKGSMQQLSGFHSYWFMPEDVK